MNRKAWDLRYIMAYACLFNLLGFFIFSFPEPVQTQGALQGEVGLLEGNCMPAPNAPPCKPRAVEAMVYISQPSENFVEAKLVDSVMSGADGTFEIALQAGDYSVFTKYESEVSCAVFRCTPECVCNPVQISADSTTMLSIKINKASW